MEFHPPRAYASRLFESPMPRVFVYLVGNGPGQGETSLVDFLMSLHSEEFYDGPFSLSSFGGEA